MAARGGHNHGNFVLLEGGRRHIAWSVRHVVFARDRDPPESGTGGGAFGHRAAERPGGGERAVQGGVDGTVRLGRRRRHQRREQSADLGHQLGRGVRRRAEVDVAPLGALYLELVQRSEGRRRQEAVGSAARHREVCESVSRLLVLLRHRAGSGVLSAEERRGRFGEDLGGFRVLAASRRVEMSRISFPESAKRAGGSMRSAGELSFRARIAGRVDCSRVRRGSPPSASGGRE